MLVFLNFYSIKIGAGSLCYDLNLDVLYNSISVMSDLEEMLNDPCPKHSLPGQPSTLTHGRIVFIMREYQIIIQVTSIIMGRQAGQAPVRRDPALVVAAQVLAIRVKVTTVVITNTLVKVISSRITSPGAE